MKLIRNCVVLCLAFSFSLSLKAGEAEIRKALETAITGIPIVSITKGQFAELYEVRLASGQVLFSNADGSNFVMGEMFSTTGGKLVNMSEQERDSARATAVANIAPGDFITYSPKGKVKAKIAVFTDIDCGYCRKLHQEIPALNEMGIQVSYLAFPRAGVGSRSHEKLVSAWCAEDSLKAMDAAKSGKTLPSENCDNPVANQYALGQQLGVNGTPAIILEDGTLVPGYMPADKLAKTLNLL